MGWFWANSSEDTTQKAPHPMPSSGAIPPPSCPMHNKSATPSSPTSKATLPAGACPYNPSDATAPSPPSSTELSPHSSSTSALSKLNPLNWMPYSLSQERAAGQTQSLPVSRDPSSIPKGDGTGNWEYPSPQQMYNAMLRKGYSDTPIDAVESMVAIHNFLNEGAWAEIVEWERRFAGGLASGWRNCARGEDGSLAGATIETDWHDSQIPEPKLVRFMGRPGEMTPKAQLLQALGKAWPAKFGSEPPFDRHDWFVTRCDKDGSCKEVRYVIDYYEGPPEPTGEPVFYLDVRPAVDGPTAACERLLRWGGDVWWRASGGVTRELEQLKQQRGGR